MLFFFSCENSAVQSRDNDSIQSRRNDSLQLLNHINDSLQQENLAEIKKELIRDSGFIFRKYNNKFRFEMFKVDHIYKGKYAKPNFENFKGDVAGFDRFRDDYLEEYKSRKVNFAGHYSIIEISCGSWCQCVSVVDRINGKIYEHASFDTADGHYGLLYQTDSRMIIIDSGLLDVAESHGYKGYYDAQYKIRPSTYEWKDSVFVKID
jgi:hypothetical protein